MWCHLNIKVHDTHVKQLAIPGTILVSLLYHSGKISSIFCQNDKKNNQIFEHDNTKKKLL